MEHQVVFRSKRLDASRRLASFFWNVEEHDAPDNWLSSRLRRVLVAGRRVPEAGLFDQLLRVCLATLTAE